MPYVAELALSACLVTAVLAGYGGWLLRRLLPGAGAIRLPDAILAGAVAVVAISQAANLFVPLAGWPNAALTALGLILLAASRDALATRPPQLAGFGAMLLLFLAATLAWGDAVAYDTGLYHLQTVQWKFSAATPFGLANVHDRLGFNSAWLGLCAAFFLPGLEWSGPFACAAVLVASVLSRLLDGVRDDGARSWSANFALMALAFVLAANAAAQARLGFDLLFQNMGSLGTDLPAMLLTLASFYYVLRWWEWRAESDRVLAVLSATLCVSVKVSQLPILLLMPLLWLGARPPRRALYGSIGVAAAAFCTWLAQNLVLSGCLIFPAEAVCLHALDWAVPADHVRTLAAVIKAWARWPGMPAETTLASWDWLRVWWQGSPRQPTAYVIRGFLALWLLGAALDWALARRAAPTADGSAGRFLPGPVAYMLAVAAVGCGFWFVTAPNVRFGTGFLISATLLLYLPAVVKSSLLARLPWPATPRWVHGAALLTAAVAILLYGNLPDSADPGPPAVLSREDTAFVAYKSDHGLDYVRPAEGDRCWAVKEICAPTAIPRVERFDMMGRPAFRER